MVSAPLRRCVLLSVAATALLGAPVRDAEAQCTVSAPQQFLSNPSPYPRFRTAGYVNSLGLYKDQSGIQRMLSIDNYGYYIFNLADPSSPSYMSQLDIEQTVPRVGDTFSILGSLATAPDGSRALVTTGHTAENGVLLMKGNSSAFVYGGDFKPKEARAVVLDQNGSKWWGYALKDQYLYVADVSSFWTGNPSTKPNSVPSSFYDIGPVVPRSASVANHLIVFAVGSSGIRVADARNPGSGSFPIYSVSATTLGFGAGTSVERVSSTVHPNGTVYIVAEGVINGNQTAGFVMGTLSSDGSSFSRKGNLWMPPSPYSGTGSITSASRPALVSDSSNGEVWAFVWGGSAASRFKLFGLSLKEWEGSGSPSDLTPNASYQSSDSWATIATTEPLKVGSTIYLYVGATNSGQALTVSCTSQNSPPTATISVTNVSDGDTVFVGDSLRVHAAVAPAPSSSQLADWAFDFNYHSNEGSGSTYPILQTPDRTQSAASSQPFSNELVIGPCDPRTGGALASGAGCWASVLGDFASTAEGAVQPLRFAMEARNGFGSSSLRTFTINWKIPKARFTPVAVLNGGQLSDASEGSPRSDGAGFRWYFGETPGSTAVVEDVGCRDKRTCTHPFNNGKGKYKAWIQAAYSNGFVTAGVPASSASLRDVDVQDVVLGVTGASASVTRTGSATSIPLKVTKTASGSINDCPASGSPYAYSICKTTDSACASASSATYLPLTVDGSGNAPISFLFPENGDYYLRVKYTYGTGSCTSPLSESWKPGLESDPTAFKISATDVVTVPSIYLAGLNGSQEYPLCALYCSGGKFSVSPGQTIVVYAYVNGVVDPNPPPGLSWSFGSAGSPSPSSGNGQGVRFSYSTAATTATITMQGYPQTYTFLGKVSGTTPPPPTGLSVTASANPNPGTVNQAVSFTAAASGGTSPYTYSWNFTDGATSNQQNPSHSYSATGSYSVVCTATDQTGAQASRTVFLTVNPVAAPTLAVALTDTQTGTGLFAYQGKFQAASGQSITFTARLGESLASNVIWVFGDGQQSAANPATYVYTNTTASDKTFNGSISNGGSTINFAVLVTKAVNQNPTGAYTYRYVDTSAVDIAKVDASKAVRFTASEDADSYDWDFGDSSLHGTTKSVDHTFPATGGAYRVALKEVKAGTTYTTASPVTFTIPAPPEPPRWMLVGMASTEGQGGAYWRSDVTIYNPSAEQGMALRLAFLDASKTVKPEDLKWAVVILPPLGTKTVVDILGNGALPDWGLFTANRSGALLIQGDTLPTNTDPVVVGKTYNTGTVESGTYGLSIPAVRVTEGVKPSSVAAASQLIGLRQTDDFYTNLAVVNLRADDAEVEVRFYNAAGALVGQPVTYQVGPYGIQQKNNILRDVAGYPDPLDSFRAVLTIKKGTGVTAFASVTDVRSKDPIFIAPQPKTNPSYRLPGIVRAAGANNSLFRSDVVLYNTSSAARTATLAFTYRSSKDTSVTNKFWEIPLAANQVVDINDFVKTQLNLAESDDTSYYDSFVDVQQNDSGQDPILVMGRTYNKQDNGSTGLQVKAFGPDDTASASGVKKRLILTGLKSSADQSVGFRSNVAVFLGTPGQSGSAQLKIRLYDGNGDSQGTLNVSLSAAKPFLQIGDRELFGGARWDLSNITVVVDVISGTVPVAGYATTLDNRSNDAVFTGAVALP